MDNCVMALETAFLHVPFGVAFLAVVNIEGTEGGGGKGGNIGGVGPAIQVIFKAFETGGLVGARFNRTVVGGLRRVG